MARMSHGFEGNFGSNLELHFDGSFFASTEDDEREGIALVVAGNELRKRVVEVYFYPTHGNDDIPYLESGTYRWGISDERESGCPRT